MGLSWATTDLETISRPELDVDGARRGPDGRIPPFFRPPLAGFKLQRKSSFDELNVDSLRLTWTKYIALLSALAAAGIIEDSYLLASIGRGQTLLRPPGVYRALPRRRLLEEASF